MGKFKIQTVLICMMFAFVILLYGCSGSSSSPVSSDPEVADNNCNCDPIDTLIGETITVSSVSELTTAVNTINASGGSRTVLMADGTYHLNSLLHITADNVMLRSVSGDRSRVILEGNGMTGNIPHIFLIAASNITIADISLGEVANHGIQVQGENGANDLLVHNVRLFNTGEQMLKGSYGGASGSENGIVECSLFEYTNSFGPQYYIGGIDIHRGINWIVRNNTFKNIRSPENRIAEHAIHFWSDSQNPIIENNTIINCDRGIGLGLGESSGCIGGIIRNNMIFANNQGLNNDVGIALETARDIRVINNTIFLDHGYANAMEYRFSGSVGNEIINNLTNKAITSRNSGQADVRNNVTTAESTWFTDPAAGDLHLDYPVESVMDSGETIPIVGNDLDCDPRPAGGGYDIGADEY